MQEKIIKLNNRLCAQFQNERTEENLKQYVMSELLSPIEDYPHVVEDAPFGIPNDGYFDELEGVFG